MENKSCNSSGFILVAIVAALIMVSCQPAHAIGTVGISVASRGFVNARPKTPEQIEQDRINHERYLEKRKQEAVLRATPRQKSPDIPEKKLMEEKLSGVNILQ